jgi:hypothetical protein
VENVRVLPVFGKGTLNVSPRVGILHVPLDHLPWWWADASDNNTIDLAGIPPGEHKVLIELVNTDLASSWTLSARRLRIADVVAG